MLLPSYHVEYLLDFYVLGCVTTVHTGVRLGRTHRRNVHQMNLYGLEEILVSYTKPSTYTYIVNTSRTSQIHHKYIENTSHIHQKYITNTSQTHNAYLYYILSVLERTQCLSQPNYETENICKLLLNS
jgi:hypothetical protein